jgi:ribulose-bisphosphate carboxylase large chain
MVQGVGTQAIEVTYRVSGADPATVAEAIRVEQTVEFPLDLTPGWIAREVVGSITNVTADEVTIAFDAKTAGGGIGQLLNLIWGNVSLFPGVRLTRFDIPDALAHELGGPRFGVPGLRDVFQAPTRPLLMTALKPMGTSAEDLARMGQILASAGFDIVKDDHGLADQPWATWMQRITTIGPAIAKAASIAGTRTVYAPSLNVPAERIREAAHLAKDHGAGALLVMPGVNGFDALRTLADDEELNLPLLAHPSFLGSHLVNPDQGIDHGVLLGTLARLAGADVTIFPHPGGRFTFTESECARIRDCCSADLSGLPSIWPSPAGGMTTDRIDEIIEFYGSDVAILIGGALHRGDLSINAQQMVATAHRH